MEAQQMDLRGRGCRRMLRSTLNSMWSYENNVDISKSGYSDEIESMKLFTEDWIRIIKFKAHWNDFYLPNQKPVEQSNKENEYSFFPFLTLLSIFWFVAWYRPLNYREYNWLGSKSYHLNWF